MRMGTLSTGMIFARPVRPKKETANILLSIWGNYAPVHAFYYLCVFALCGTGTNPGIERNRKSVFRQLRQKRITTAAYFHANAGNALCVYSRTPDAIFHYGRYEDHDGVRADISARCL